MLKFDFQVDTYVEENGEWFTPPMLQPPADSGRPANRLHIRSMESEVYTEKVRDLYKEARADNLAKGQDENPTTEQFETIQIRSIAEAGIIDWELYDVNGEPVHFSPEEAAGLFEDRSSRRAFVAAWDWCHERLTEKARNWQIDAGKDSSQE